MPKPTRFSYEKKQPFRDASYFIIVCEGENREPDYFRFFDGMSSRVKIVPVEPLLGAGAPTRLIQNAIDKEKELDAKPDVDKVWFVIDTDRWGKQLHDLRDECSRKPHWQIAQSNPCFEVWLYFHAYSNLPDAELLKCGDWKPYVHSAIIGGFNCDYHPASIEDAIANARASCKEDGYFPQTGSTQVWVLAENLLKIFKKDLDAVKWKYPKPEAANNRLKP